MIRNFSEFSKAHREQIDQIIEILNDTCELPTLRRFNCIPNEWHQEIAKLAGGQYFYMSDTIYFSDAQYTMFLLKWGQQ